MFLNKPYFPLDMTRSYPTSRPSTAPGTGRLLYEFLMRNIKISAGANHTIWYEGEKTKLEAPDKYAFRGEIPIGNLLVLVGLGGKMFDFSKTYMVDGSESYILVSDLAPLERERLGIPSTCRDRDKVFNSNFKPYDDLPEMTKWSNELAALSVPKSISTYLGGVKGKVNYSEVDALKMLQACFIDLSGPEMMHILHGNNAAWTALAYMREKGNVEGDILTEFHGQNSADFFSKDLGTVLPALYFALASLGENPSAYHQKIDLEVWGSKEAASYMLNYMPKQGTIVSIAG